MTDHRSEDSRALLALARDGGLPNDAQLARARSRLAERIAAGVVTSGAAAIAARTISTKAAAWSSSLVLKTATVVAVVVGVAAAAVHHAHEDVAVLPAPPSAQAAPAPPGRQVGERVVEAPPVEAPRGEGARVVVPHEQPPARLVRRSASPARRPPITPSASGEREARSAVPVGRSAGLMDDVAHLREAQRALAAGDAARAREEAEHVGEDGPLGEEGEGMRVLAACAEPARAEESRLLADRFARRRPQSSLLPRIRAACSTR